MTDDVSEWAFVGSVFCLKSGKAVWNISIVSSPILVDLSIEDLSDRDESQGCGKVSSNTTSNTSDDSFLFGSEIISWLYWFESIIDDFIKSVSDGQVTKSWDKISLKSLVESHHATTERVHLSEYFVWIVALI